MCVLTLLTVAALTRPGLVQEATSPTRPTISISSGVEDGRKMLIATVTLGEKPLEGAVVAFYVERTFGRMMLGREETLEDGTAAIPFPDGLPGGPQGELRFLASLDAPAEHVSVFGSATLPGGVPASHDADPFPHALWSPRSPIALVMTLTILLGIVWSTYLFVVVQLIRIWKGASS